VKKLAIDFEFPSRIWWESGGQELWDAVSEGFGGSAVIVDEHLAASWLEQARALPGWTDGHEYAPHPVRLGDVDPEEEDQG